MSSKSSRGACWQTDLIRVVACFLLLWSAGSVLAQGDPHLLLLTTAAAVHDLAPEKTSHAQVHLRGTITYYDPFEHTMFLEDATGGVYIDTDRAYPVSQGDVVTVDGAVASSFRSQVSLNPSIQRVATGQLREAAPTGFAVLATGKMDCRLVRLRGLVRTVDVEQHATAPILHLDVLMPGGSVEVYQPVSVIDGRTISRYVGLNKTSLLDAEVEITGVAGGAFDTKAQQTGVIVYAQESSAIRVITPPRVNPLQLPLTSMKDVYPSRQVVDASERVRLQGTLTYYKKGDSAVLESKGASIFVQTRETRNIPIGDVVDAIGFASDQEYAPSLREAELFDTGKQEAIQPSAINYDKALSGMFSDNLIALTGTLVSQLHGKGEETLVISVDGHLVTGRVEGSVGLPNYSLGARIRMVGVCRIVPGGPWRAPTMFHLEMRAPDDVTMISAPSWWTVEHLAELLGILLLAALSVGLWAVLLRRRVGQQTQRIERSMLVAEKRSRLLEQISLNQPPTVLLEEICACVATLLPGTQARYWLESGNGQEKKRRFAREIARLGEVLHELALQGQEGETVGQLVVCSLRPKVRGNQKEVFAMVSEMTCLAMRQSLLYEGLIHHSTHDPLTDLPNRRLCDDQLRRSLVEAQQHAVHLTVLYIDVNRFKHVNDRYGHKVGDLYLKAISTRLHAQIRTSDMLARIGGDEFLVIAPQAAAGEERSALSERLKACFDDPFYLEGNRIEGSASFGLATYPEHGTTADELKRYADHAMYLAKRSSASGDPGGAMAPVAILTVDELTVALSRDQFRLAYQPQFSAEGRLQGMEALLRLEDSILGTLTPDAFISVAERSDLILILGKWVLERALTDAVRWDLHEGEPMLMVVNVALRQVVQTDFAEMVLRLLAKYRFPAERLELELTERTLVSNSDEIRRQLETVRQAGVRVSLDDFGTGHSSLSLLHRLPIDTIKVDRSFVTAIEAEPNVLPVVEAITYMAQRLGKRIVAEGVESAATVPALLRMGEMDFQGYLLSRPLLAAEVDAVLGTWRSGLEMEPEFRTTPLRDPQTRTQGWTSSSNSRNKQVRALNGSWQSQ